MLRDAALQIGRSNRIAGTIQGDTAGVCRRLDFGKPAAQCRQLGGDGAEPGRQQAFLREHSLTLIVNIHDRSQDDEITPAQYQT